VKTGKAGEVVVSNLYARGTVLLNYRLGDLARWRTEPCRCGRTLPVLELTGARAGSTLRLRDGRPLQEHVILHACKERMHDVLQFQIVEHAPESVVWRVVAREGANREELASDLVSGSRSVMSQSADVRVEFVDRIERCGGKLSRIVQASAPDEEAGVRSAR
jgi:phenylacetate-coenzyme A ligase PaaK-like adenylate-forming protein